MGTFTQLTYQLVFGAKDRQIFLREESQNELFNYFKGTLKNMGCTPFAVGGHVDHVHLVFSATGRLSIGKIVQDIKTSSNSFIHRNPLEFGDFQSWQVGYGAFSYRISEIDKLISYVKGQKEHHKTVTFQEEYIALLEEHGIEYDLQYLFS